MSLEYYLLCPVSLVAPSRFPDMFLIPTIMAITQNTKAIVSNTTMWVIKYTTKNGTASKAICQPNNFCFTRDTCFMAETIL